MIAILAAAAIGALNPNVSQANIGTTICARGWTATIRPPASYTSRLKRRQMAALGMTLKPRQVEEDHYVPLELGGQPRDPNNLWPQPWHGPWNAHDKDRVEDALHRAVCSGRMTLDQAQRAIRTWQREYVVLFGAGPKAGR